MSADIINLKRVRKQRARAEKAQQAERNRAQFGRTMAERTTSAADVARAGSLLDGARIEPPANEGGFPAVAAHDGSDDLDPGSVS